MFFYIIRIKARRVCITLNKFSNFPQTTPNSSCMNSQIFEIIFRIANRLVKISLSTARMAIHGANTARSGKWSAYRKKGRNTTALYPAICTPRSRLGVSCRSAAPANWFFSSPRRRERRSISLASAGHTGAAGTWRKNPSDVTRHPVFQSGIDKKSLLFQPPSSSPPHPPPPLHPLPPRESRHGNNYARNITVRARRARFA